MAAILPLFPLGYARVFKAFDPDFLYVLSVFFIRLTVLPLRLILLSLM